MPEWVGQAQSYLRRLGEAEAKARKGKPGQPSDYMRALLAFLGRGDEEGFKAEKNLRGYTSALKF